MIPVFKVKMVSLYVVAAALLVLSLYLVKKDTGSVNQAVRKGYKQSGDTTSTMLDRIEWSNHHRGRVSFAGRYMFYALVITLAASIIFVNGFPPASTFLQMAIVTWLALMSFHSYFSHHADKFSSYTIDSNLAAVRKKLGLEKGDLSKLSEQLEGLPGHHGCFTFFYQA